jgi:hypothetical protein
MFGIPAGRSGFMFSSRMLALAVAEWEAVGINKLSQIAIHKKAV